MALEGRQDFSTDPNASAWEVPSSNATGTSLSIIATFQLSRLRRDLNLLLRPVRLGSPHHQRLRSRPARTLLGYHLNVTEPAAAAAPFCAVRTAVAYPSIFRLPRRGVCRLRRPQNRFAGTQHQRLLVRRVVTSLPCNETSRNLWTRDPFYHCMPTGGTVARGTLMKCCPEHASQKVAFHNSLILLVPGVRFRAFFRLHLGVVSSGVAMSAAE